MNSDNSKVSDDTPEDTSQEQPETFPREYVEKLRREAATYRDRAKGADDLRAALWAARVEATGRLADATDLPMPEGADPLDADAVTQALDSLLESKPHLAARTPQGNIGQGAGEPSEAFDLAGMLRGRA